MKDRLPGLYWGGYVDQNGISHHNAYFKMAKVQTIIDTVKEVSGDLNMAAGLLNYDDSDFEVDDPLKITPEEIAKLIEFASEYPIEVTKELSS